MRLQSGKGSMLRDSGTIWKESGSSTGPPGGTEIRVRLRMFWKFHAAFRRMNCCRTASIMIDKRRQCCGRSPGVLVGRETGSYPGCRRVRDPQPGGNSGIWQTFLPQGSYPVQRTGLHRADFRIYSASLGDVLRKPEAWLGSGADLVPYWQ